MDQALNWLTANPWALYVAFGFLALLLGRKSQIDAWVEKHPWFAGVMKILRGVGLDPWLLVQGLCLLVFGRLPKNAWFKPKLPPGAGVVILALTCGSIVGAPVLLTACSASQATRAHMVESGKALAFNAAVTALVLIDDRDARWRDGLKNPTEAQVLSGRKKLERLKFVRAQLELVRGWLAGEKEVDAPAVLREAMSALRDLADLMKSEGIEIPEEAELALEMGATYL